MIQENAEYAMETQRIAGLFMSNKSEYAKEIIKLKEKEPTFGKLLENSFKKQMQQQFGGY